MTELAVGDAREAFADSHCHLADPAFAPDLHEVVGRARAVGCRHIVSIATTPTDAAVCAEIARAYPGFIFGTVGVHPHEAAGFDDARDPDSIRALLHAGAVAVGECGLDYHYDHAARDVQRRVLAVQVAIAAECGRPVVVHTREAEDDTIAVIRDAERASVRGILHCFTGSARLAGAALAAGWYVSYAGVVTFKKWDGDALLRDVPRDRLLLESDAPYLAPVPHRGKRNEPAHVAQTLAHVARTRGEDAASLGAQVVANTVRCFGLDVTPGIP